MTRFLGNTSNENYTNYIREKLKFRKLATSSKRKFYEEYMESISPQTSITEVWKKAFWITGKLNKNTGLKDFVEESISNATEFFDTNFVEDNQDLASQQTSSPAHNNNFTASLGLEELKTILKKKNLQHLEWTE